MGIDTKLRLLYLLQILQEGTDDDNYLTTAQLASILKHNMVVDGWGKPENK